MNEAPTNQLILTYVEGWKVGDREQILSTLDPACVVIESYGPTYRGKAMIGRWIDSQPSASGKTKEYPQGPYSKLR